MFKIEQIKHGAPSAGLVRIPGSACGCSAWIHSRSCSRRSHLRSQATTRPQRRPVIPDDHRQLGAAGHLQATHLRWSHSGLASTSSPGLPAQLAHRRRRMRWRSRAAMTRDSDLVQSLERRRGEVRRRQHQAPLVPEVDHDVGQGELLDASPLPSTTTMSSYRSASVKTSCSPRRRCSAWSALPDRQRRRPVRPRRAPRRRTSASCRTSSARRQRRRWSRRQR